jgi:hypothetical protein
MKLLNNLPVVSVLAPPTIAADRGVTPPLHAGLHALVREAEDLLAGVVDCPRNRSKTNNSRPRCRLKRLLTSAHAVGLRLAPAKRLYTRKAACASHPRTINLRRS